MNEKLRRKEPGYKDKPLLNFRFPSQEDINLAAKIENSQMYQNNRDEISDPSDTLRCKSNSSSDHNRGTIFDLLVNNPALGSRKSNSHASDLEESHRIQEKFKEQLINATKTQKPFDAFHNSIKDSNTFSDENSKDELGKSRFSSDQDKRSNSIANNGPESNVAASVQAALNALQAGQLSLNQVKRLYTYMMLRKIILCYNTVSSRGIIVFLLYVYLAFGSTASLRSSESRVLSKIDS